MSRAVNKLSDKLLDAIDGSNAWYILGAFGLGAGWEPNNIVMLAEFKERYSDKRWYEKETGWTDGPCHCLALALQKWLDNDECKAYSVGGCFGGHAFVQVGDLCIDGNGITTYEKLLYDWKWLSSNVTRKPLSTNTRKALTAESRHDFLQRWNIKDEDRLVIEPLVKLLDKKLDRDEFLEVLGAKELQGMAF
jgi:hypothetical protein